MSDSRLDQLVKGAPPPKTSIPIILSRSPSSASAAGAYLRSTTPFLVSDPLASTPSSPPHIYLNLLILEASLRSQYLTLRARRRQNTFFCFVLGIWIGCFGYALFIRPREDGSGIGGSVYWVVEMAEKVALMGGIVTAILIWGTGQWDRGMRWPKRWIGYANRGLRNINAKIVVLKGSWLQETWGILSFLFPYSSFFPSPWNSSRDIDISLEKHSRLVPRTGAEDDDDFNQLLADEDLSPGGDFIKLLLLPKPFSADFRENWELYRLDYWEKENERRGRLRQKLKKYRKAYAKENGGWLWWTGWRGWDKPKEVQPRSFEEEKPHHKQRRRLSHTGSDSHSRTTSRSSTPAPLEGEERPLGRIHRRGSSNASGSERRRKVKALTSIDGVPIHKPTRKESRSSLFPTSEND